MCFHPDLWKDETGRRNMHNLWMRRANEEPENASLHRHHAKQYANAWWGQDTPPEKDALPKVLTDILYTPPVFSRRERELA